MKVLFITPYLPTPPRFGGQRRLHGLMVELARHHEISNLSFVNPRDDNRESLEATRRYCKRVVVVPNRDFGAPGVRKRLLQLRSLAARHSFEHRISCTRLMHEALNRLLAEESFDVVQVEFSNLADLDFGAGRRRPRLCLDLHNIEYDVLRRTAEANVGKIRRAYNAINWRKIRREERRAWRRFDGCVLTSARDEALLLSEVPGVRTAVVPNGVDVDSFVPTQEVVEEPDTIVFLGAINYFPNTDGLLFFLREAWPTLKRLRPRVRLRIVGPKPPNVIANWPDPRVRVIGYVDDVRPEMARASAIIVPLRIGGGTRLKVLEAMALGKAVVSTTLGAEGLDVTHEHDILLADDGPGLAAQLARVLSDETLSRRLGEDARKLAVDRYSWRSAAERLARFYSRLGAARYGEMPSA
jgi:glycosyltransferase involved in cell wall biosynthesis